MRSGRINGRHIHPKGVTDPERCEACRPTPQPSTPSPQPAAGIHPWTLASSEGGGPVPVVEPVDSVAAALDATMPALADLDPDWQSRWSTASLFLEELRQRGFSVRADSPSPEGAHHDAGTMKVGSSKTTTYGWPSPEGAEPLVAAWRRFSDRFARGEGGDTPIRDAFAAGWDAGREAALPDMRTPEEGTGDV